MSLSSSLLVLLLFFCISSVFCGIDRIPEALQNRIKVKSDTSWEEFKQAFEKTYFDEADELEHKEVFLKRREQIKEHNEAFEKGDVSYQLGFSALTDLTDQERHGLNGFRLRDGRSEVPHHGFLGQGQVKMAANGGEAVKNSRVDISRMPPFVDWRKGNGSLQLVTSVKNQLRCGSCWAFSTVGVLEAANAKATGRLRDLSPQNLVDCDETNFGCRGGFPMMALAFAMDEGGLNQERAYPYVGVDAKCRYNNLRPVGGSAASQIVLSPPGDEKALMAAVATEGPISVAIQVSYNFQDYAGGVLNDRTCSSKLLDLNHAVLLVGYGTDPKWGDYWLVKNSWGAKWGENGYIRMARNKNNQCGIATQAVYVKI